jgi:serine phosphatase RsbU (regulator of sigma subunit)
MRSTTKQTVLVLVLLSALVVNFTSCSRDTRSEEKEIPGDLAAEDSKRVTYLSSEDIERAGAGLVWLTENWRYHPGDDPSWANPDFDDSHWEFVHPGLNLGRQYPKEGWSGNGWFRLHLKIDSTLQNRPLGMRLRHLGASAIFLDGRLLFKFGTVGKDIREEGRFYPQYPRTVIFSGDGDHVISVRYSNHCQSTYMRKLAGVGFSMNIGHMDDAVSIKMLWSVRYQRYMLVIMVSSLLLALFHSFLFFYNPKQRVNLYLTLLSTSFAGYAFFTFQSHFTSDPGQFILFSQLRVLTSVVLVILQLLTIYKLFYTKLPKWFFLFLTYGFVVVVMLAYSMSELGPLSTWFMILGFAETARAGIMKGLKHKGGYRIVVAGLILLFISIVYQILINLQMVEPIGTLFLPYVYGFGGFLLSMSILLALQFAQTTRNLQTQLTQVRELSEKMLEQERLAREQEIARRLLEADNKRKTEELEEARELQLSMLPKNLPQVPDLDIAAFMKTANEVGGDYYDFCVGADGALIVAIGDATSHGMKAGLMVSLMKSLFLAEAPCMDVIPLLNKCSQTIKKMQLGNLYMSLMLLKIKGSRITASAAGMPPILIYRSQQRRVEAVAIKGLPLGGPAGATYKEVHEDILPGDTVLLMSDGFPELFDDDMEMLDYSRAKELFEETAERSPEEIISHLRKAAEQWLNGKAQDDDITFVALKCKGVSQ